MPQPLFAAPPPQANTAEVAWVPQPGGTGRVIVVWLESAIPVTVSAGLTLALGDVVSLTRIGQTYRVDSIVTKAITTPTEPPATEEPEPPAPTD
ncbi:hypothetical protein [Luteipulveratus halotolerans]|nr:hypothetical protein [Luteipulveratus halotolerans]